MGASRNTDGRVSVAYIDDQTLFREAVVGVLEDSGVITVRHSAGHNGSLAQLLKDTEISAVLMALDMQVHDPMSSLRELRRSHPDVPVCALVAVDRLERAREAIAEGCKGAVSTAASINMLISALQNIVDGQAYVDPALAGRLLAKNANRHPGARNNRTGNNMKLITKPGEISNN